MAKAQRKDIFRGVRSVPSLMHCRTFGIEALPDKVPGLGFRGGIVFNLVLLSCIILSLLLCEHYTKVEVKSQGNFRKKLPPRKKGRGWEKKMMDSLCMPQMSVKLDRLPIPEFYPIPEGS